MAAGRGRPLGLWERVAFYSSLGFILPAALVGGVALGWYLDRRLDSGPVLEILLGVAGAVAGFVEILRLMAREEKREAENEPPDRTLQG